MSSSREVRKFVYQALRHGVDIRHLDGQKHWTVYHEGHRVGTIAYSPSDSRWRLNAISMIKRVTSVDLRTPPRKHRHVEPDASDRSVSADTDGHRH